LAAEHGGAVDAVDAVQAGRADQPVAVFQDDAEHQVFRALVAAKDERLFVLQVEGRPLLQRPRDLLVVDPALQGGGVGQLERTQIEAFADNVSIWHGGITCLGLAATQGRALVWRLVGR
jgi:hypothetical protein